MKLNIRSLVAVILITVSVNQSYAVDYRQEDKQKHLAATTGISSITYGISRGYKASKTKSFFLAMGVSLGVGVAKELSDPIVDEEDLQADLLGAVVGTLFSWTIDF